MKESQQHALESALVELIGGRTPPDQTFPILAAVHRARQQRPEAAAPPRPLRRRRPWLLGAAAGAAAALLLWISTRTEEQPRASVPELPVQVLDGTFLWQALGTAHTAATGESFTVVPQIGDRWIADPFAETRARLGGLGSLTMTPGTQLEIEDMKWQEFGIGFGSGSLTVAVVVGSFTWLAGDGSDLNAVSGDAAELSVRGPAVVADGGDQQLAEQLASARAEIDQLRTAAQREAVRATSAETVAVPGVEAEDEFRALELDSELDALLATLDWRLLSERSLELSETLQKAMTLLAAGEDLPAELVGELERLKGTLHAQAGFLDEGLIPGTNFDTQARHPLVGAQWMSAVLQYSDLPLDDTQRMALTDLARRYAAEDEARRAGYGEDTSLIEKYIDELQMQDRFYEDAGYLMSDAQKQLFSAGEFEGRVGAKLVGNGSMAWGEWTQPVVVRSRDEFTSAMTTGFANALGLEGAQLGALRAVVHNWGQAFPPEWWDRPFDELDRYGGYDVERLKVAAQLQLQFFEQVANTVGLTAEQLQILSKVRSLVVPYQRN